MRRYKKLTTRIPSPEKGGLGAIDIDNVMVEDSNGEWIKWEDVKGILQYKDQLKGYTICTCDNVSCTCGRPIIGSLEIKSKCNCAEHVYTDVPLGPTTWICPAHGYKRR